MGELPVRTVNRGAPAPRGGLRLNLGFGAVLAAAGGVCAGLFGAPIAASLAAGATAFVIGGVAGAGLMGPRRARARKLDAGRLLTDEAAAARAMIAESVPEAERLVAAAKAIRDRGQRARVLGLAATANEIFRDLSAEPARIAVVSRFLSYYLPTAAGLAEGFRALEAQNPPDLARLTQTGAMIEKLDSAFADYRNKLSAADVETLDVELRLLEKSLAEDLGAPADGGGGSGR